MPTPNDNRIPECWVPLTGDDADERIERISIGKEKGIVVDQVWYVPYRSTSASKSTLPMNKIQVLLVVIQIAQVVALAYLFLNYAESGHAHPGYYAESGHDHITIFGTNKYAEDGHNHRGEYAEAYHTHSHNHWGEYAENGHDHSFNHPGEYAEYGHKHRQLHTHSSF